jgi:putative SOS response-associated peptidase YedK
VCGRLALSSPPTWLAAWVAAHLQEPADPGGLQARPMGSPGELVPVLVQQQDQRVLRAAWWGLPGPGSPGRPGRRRIINARAETVMARPTFRPLLPAGRCLVLADGFLEWTGPVGRRRAVRFEHPDGTPLALAGLVRADPEGLACVVLTVDANPDVAPVHDRMPALLRAEDWRRWLTPVPDPGTAPLDLLQPAPPGSLTARELEGDPGDPPGSAPRPTLPRAPRAGARRRSGSRATAEGQGVLPLG